MSSIRVRFAPSPTGTLHVGGARTALLVVLARQGLVGYWPPAASGGNAVQAPPLNGTARSMPAVAAAWHPR